MGRLVTCGFDFGSASPEGQGIGIPATAPTYGTSFCLNGGTGYGGQTLGTTKIGSYWQWSFTGSTTDTYFARYLLRLPSGTDFLSSGVNRSIFNFETAAAGYLFGLRAKNDSGTPKLAFCTDAGGTLATSATEITVSLDTIYCIEFELRVNSGVAKWRLDGVQQDSLTPSLGSTAPGRINIGHLTALASGNQLKTQADDIILNDSTGSADTTYPGSLTARKLALIRPNGESAIDANWNDGDDSGPAVATMVDRVPVKFNTPAALTSTEAITDRGGAGANDDDAIFTFPAYNTVASGTVNLIQGAACTASNSTTATAGGIQLRDYNSGGSDSTEASFSAYCAPGAGNTASTAEFSWAGRRSPAITAPSLALTDTPKLLIGKRTAANRHAICNGLGIYVDYTTTAPAAGFARSQAIVF